jgi:hypothetical protein
MVADAAYHVLHKNPLTLPNEFAEASALALQLRDYLRTPTICAEIANCHKLHASSQQIQAVVHTEVERLGFQSEKTGLFGTYKVSALRPDFY